MIARHTQAHYLHRGLAGVGQIPLHLDVLHDVNIHKVLHSVHRSRHDCEVRTAPSPAVPVGHIGRQSIQQLEQLAVPDGLAVVKHHALSELGLFSERKDDLQPTVIDATSARWVVIIHHRGLGYTVCRTNVLERAPTRTDQIIGASMHQPLLLPTQS